MLLLHRCCAIEAAAKIAMDIWKLDSNPELAGHVSNDLFKMLHDGLYDEYEFVKLDSLRLLQDIYLHASRCPWTETQWSHVIQSIKHVNQHFGRWVCSISYFPLSDSTLDNSLKRRKTLRSWARKNE